MVLPRLGSALRPNVQRHARFLDGAFPDGPARFFTAPASGPREVEAALVRIVVPSSGSFAMPMPSDRRADLQHPQRHRRRAGGLQEDPSETATADQRGLTDG